jgi:hypothetical protein
MTLDMSATVVNICKAANGLVNAEAHAAIELGAHATSFLLYSCVGGIKFVSTQAISK